MKIQLKERPNKKISKKKEEITIFKNGKTSKATIEISNVFKILFEKKEFVLEGHEKYNGMDIGYYDKFYKKVEELTGGKVIGCMNCKFFRCSGLMWEQTAGWGGNCCFPRDVSKKRFVFDDFGEDFDNYNVQRSDNLKNTTILDYCTEFNLEKDQ